MRERLERDLRHAIDRFTAEILGMAQRAAIQVIQSAVAVGANPSQAPTSGDRRTLARARRPPRPASSALAASVAAFVREHPGSSTAQISQSLGLYTGVIRRHLRELADRGVIRIEEEAIGGVTRRTYFGASHVDGLSPVQAGRAPTGETTS